jgi:hypothetical protein
MTAFSMADVKAGIEALLATITGQFTIANIAEIIGLVLGGVIGLFLFWWGARWVVKRITGAFTKGRLSL